MKDKPFILNAAVLSEFLEGNRKDIATITLWRNKETEEISFTMGIWGANGKIIRVPVDNQMFIKPPTERVHFEGIINAHNKNSGKQKFWHFEGTNNDFTYVVRKMVVHFKGKKIVRNYKVYVGEKPDKNAANHEMLASTIRDGTPAGIFVHNGCKYHMFTSAKNPEGIYLEVYTSWQNQSLPRFYRWSNENSFTYV